MSEFKIKDGVLMEYYGNASEVFVPEGVTEIAPSVFVEWRNTIARKRIIHLPKGLKKIGERAFYSCKWLESIEIPDSVTEIGPQAFYDCKALESLTIPENVTEIADHLFFGCSALKSISVSPAVTKIGERAFAWTKLEQFEIPKGVTRIEDGAFAYCENLSRVFIPKTVTEINDSAFCGMGGMICVEEGHPVYSSENGALFRDGGKTLMHVPPQEGKKYTVPAQVEYITSYALQRMSMYDMHPWAKITLHSGIRRIDKEAIDAFSISAPLDAHPEQLDKKAFVFPSDSSPLFYNELPIDYVADESVRRRLALGFCLYHDKYDPAYAAGYEAYVRQHMEDLKRLANKQKLEKVQEFLSEMEADMPLVIPDDMSTLKPLEKVELLEKVVLQGDAQQAEAVMKGCKKFEFSARALGIACRYRTLDVVKALVENGASFKYEQKASLKTRYAASIKTRYSQTEHWANYALMLVYTGIKLVIPTINADAYDVHFGGLPLVKLEENSAEERAAIAEYLLGKKAIDASLILLYALMWGNRPVADCLLKNGAAIDVSCAPIVGMLDGSGAAELRSEFLATLPLLSEEDCAFAFEKIGEASEKAGLKIAVPKKAFEEKDSVLLKGKVLAQIARFADGKKLSKTAILDAVTLRNDAEALSVLAQAGWLATKAQMDKLVQLANEKGRTEAAAWLINHMNSTLDIVKETEKEEKKAMRELTANPLSVSALKKLWLFKPMENGKLEITGYKGDETEITVPAMIGKDAVGAIGEEAFSPKIFSKTVKNKESRAKIEKIVLPEGIEIIGKCAFAGCSALQSAELPTTLISIGANAFKGCASLTRVLLPDNLKTLGDCAFEGCSSLEGVNIPKKVASVSANMFKDCGKLPLTDDFLIIDRRLFGYRGHSDSIEIPEGIVEIADWAFGADAFMPAPDPMLKEIRLPESLRRIGMNAFSGQEMLESIELPDGITDICDNAFAYCRALQSIRLPEKLSKLQPYTFQRCASLRKAELPAGLKNIGESAFCFCKELKEVNIPSGVTAIGDGAFNSTGLESLFIPDTVKTIGDGAVMNMLSLKDLWLPDSIRKIQYWFLGRVNTDEVRIHIIPDSKWKDDLAYKNLVFDYPKSEN